MKNLTLQKKNNNWPSLLGHDTWSDLDRLLERISESPWGRPNFPTDLAKDFSPKCDFEETAEYYALHMDIPGMKKEHISVDYQDGVLTVSGERNSEHEERKDKTYYVERSYGRFSRSFQFPHGVDGAKVSAKYTDGVLNVTLPKSAAPSTKKIQIG